MKLRQKLTSGKREVWGCKKAGCDYKEELKLWAKPVEVEVEEMYEEVEEEVREVLGCSREDVEEDEESVVDLLAQLDADERSREMGKKSAGLGAVVKGEEAQDPKAAKKAAAKAKLEAARAAKAAERDKMVTAGAVKGKGKKAAVKVKAEPTDCPLCPCCGERTGSPKSYFLMGHDGRVKGWFLKKSRGKLPEGVVLNEELEKMYKVWKKGDGATIKEIVMKVRGIK